MAHRTGLIIGKFLPPHLGHLFLIEQAQKHCEKLYVVVCSLASEPIPGKMRFQWMQQLLPDIQVLHLAEELPSYPEQHKDFWILWKNALTAILPQLPDVVFSSENYGDRLAAELGAHHEMIDLERTKYAVSATDIRNRPAEFWDFLPDVIKPYFIKRIVVTGPESTGKTTLSQKLAQHFNTVWAHEYAREYLDKKGRYVIEEDIPHIARGHIELEQRLAGQANRVMFIDTDLITTKIYAGHYFGSCPQFIIDQGKTREYDDRFMMNIDIPWVEDPQRDLGHRREEFLDIFKNEYTSIGFRYTMISGSFEERFKAAICQTERILKQPAPFFHHLFTV